MDTQPVLAPAIDASASVMCQLLSPEGDPLGAALYLPQNVGPPQLQEIVNQLLHNVLLYSLFFFFLSPISNSFILACFPQPYLTIYLLLIYSCIVFIHSGGEVALCILRWRRGALCPAGRLHAAKEW
jgi:hypothetical protein